VLNFEWDQEKERNNIRLHGVNFTDASEVFRDYFRIERLSEFHPVNFNNMEERAQAMQDQETPAFVQ